MDCIEYFAAYGHGARVKMFHTVRVDLTGTDCPYELAVCAKVGQLSRACCIPCICSYVHPCIP